MADVIVIGAGPAGVFAAYRTTGRRRVFLNLVEPQARAETREQ